MFIASASIVARKLLEDDQITACVRQIYLLGVIRKVSKRKTLTGETFCFLEKRLLSSNLSFSYELLIGPCHLPWNVLLFSCNLIGQLCLMAPVTVPCEQRLHFRCVS